MRLSAGISTPSSRGMSVRLLNYFFLSLQLFNGSSLPLFMARILADDAHYVLALHNLARFTKSFYCWPYFHFFPRDETHGDVSVRLLLAICNSPLRQFVWR